MSHRRVMPIAEAHRSLAPPCSTVVKVKLDRPRARYAVPIVTISRKVQDGSPMLAAAQIRVAVVRGRHGWGCFMPVLLEALSMLNMLQELLLAGRLGA